MCKSVPQMPVRSTLMSTSLMPISGRGTSSSHNPGSALRLTKAFTLRFLQTLRDSSNCSRLGFQPGNEIATPCFVRADIRVVGQDSNTDTRKTCQDWNPDQQPASVTIGHFLSGAFQYGYFAC